MNEMVHGPLIELRDWQKKAMALIAKHRFVCLAIHRRAGKTWLACLILIYSALSKPKSNYGYVGISAKSARDTTWGIFKTLLEPVPDVVFKEQSMTIHFGNGSVVSCLGADSSQIRGRSLNGVICDEQGFFQDHDVIGSVIRPTVSDTGGFIVSISTPNGVADSFYEAYERGQSDQYPDHASVKFTVLETDALPPEEIEAVKRDLTEAQWAREYLCDFDAEASGSRLIPQPIIAAAQGRTPRCIDQSERIVIGVDPSGNTGRDKTAYAVRQGHIVHEAGYIDATNTMEVVGAIKRLCEKYENRHHGVDCIAVDSTGGYGLGIESRLRELGYDYVIGVNFASRPVHQPERYSNRRAELWGMLAEHLIEASDWYCLPAGYEILRDLSAMEKKNSSDGKLRLTPKAETIKKLGISPDAGDAIAISYAEGLMSGERRITDPVLAQYSQVYTELNGGPPSFDSSVWGNDDAMERAIRSREKSDFWGSANNSYGEYDPI